MDFHVQGTRPASGRRPQSRINPITGEEIPMSGQYSARQHQAPSAYQQPPPAYKEYRAPTRNASRPESVPALDLGPFADRDTKYYDAPKDPYDYNLSTPKTGSTVSWGTARSTYDVGKSRQDNVIEMPSNWPSSHRTERPTGVSKLNLQDNTPRVQQIKSAKKRGQHHKAQTAWDVPPVPEDLPPPSERHRQQYKQMQQEMQKSYREKGIAPSQAAVDATVAELKLNLFAPLEKAEDEDEERVAMEKLWINQPYTKQHQLRKSDKEYLEDEKKKKVPTATLR